MCSKHFKKNDTYKLLDFDIQTFLSIIICLEFIIMEQNKVINLNMI